MKNILLITALITILTGISFSCSPSKNKNNIEENQKNKEIILRPQTTKISGPLGKAYSVIDRDYKSQGEFPKLNVEIELTDSNSLPDTFNQVSVGTSDKKGNNNYSFIGDFIVEFLDSNGNVLETADNGNGIDRLYRLTQGDKGTISFYLPFEMDNITQFRIVSDYYPNEIKSVGSSNESINDEEFDKAMKHTKEAFETTAKMINGIKEIVK